MSAAQLFAEPVLLVCLTPGLHPFSTAPYRIPCPGSPGGLNLHSSSGDELNQWIEDATRRRVVIRYDGEAFLLWEYSHRDVARIEANWAVLAATWGVPVAPPRPGPVISEELNASCWHAWHALRHIPSRKSAAEEKNEDQNDLFTTQEAEGAIPEDAPLVFVDVETTGGSPRDGARVVQIALSRLNQRTGEVDSFSSLVNPEGRESEYGAWKVHQISKWALAKAPSFSRMLPRVEELLRGAVFIAHNGRSCDEPYIKAELSRVGAEWPCLAAIDTLRVVRKLFAHLDKRKGGGGHSLGALASIFVVEQGAAHDAKGDVQTLLGVWLEIRRRNPKVTLTEMARY
jgi:DNA polymerase III epsilon subunit-like protein